MGFGCQWSGAAAADQAGLRGLSYNRRFYLLPVRCLGQIDPVVMGRAFLEGANGLLLIGCNPEECHHSYGIDHTWSRVWVLKKLLSLCGLERERIALAHSDIIKPDQFVTTVESFMKTMAALGPIRRDAETQAGSRPSMTPSGSPGCAGSWGSACGAPGKPPTPATCPTRPPMTTP